ncbi:secreted RxLR effector protein 161-like [Elaeis guineensis]|uniref:secreted RxLR effector protein 161-like n=1 Tax=Elaeis guineensis var. tenera TaxID=51953 RepID=UPI003C6DAACD
MKWILRYLKGTVNVGLVYCRDTDISGSIIGFADSDYVANKDRRKSMTGYIFTLSGCTVSWKVVLQFAVALSTIEPEYTTLAETVKEEIWLKGFIGDLACAKHKCFSPPSFVQDLAMAINFPLNRRTTEIPSMLGFLDQITVL